MSAKIRTGCIFFSKLSNFLSAGTMVLLLILAYPVSASAETKPPASAVASAHPMATAAGHEILAAGGNAFDAAVAVSATLAVVEPAGSGLGGGGFWLLHRAKDGFETMIDGREKAPLAAHRDMYLDKEGNAVRGLSINGPLAAGIPGEPAALAYIAQHYGKLPLKESLAPAIRAAREGFKVDKRYQELIKFRLKVMREYPQTAAIFLHNNEVPPLGHVIKQTDLAATLESIADKGHNGFYTGPVADKLIKGVNTEGGIWTHEDLKLYRVVERKPITGEYQDFRITSAAPPSSGGIALVTMFNILSGFNLNGMDEATRIHTIVEAMRRAYRDRAEYLGDPDFVDVPTERLTHLFYASGLQNSIRLDQATPSQSLPGYGLDQLGQDTTHFSILDQEGNRVAATLSINLPFGSGFTPPGTGLLLNDEMDDFSKKPGIPNAYGLVGAEANAIAPGKRPLSSMSPTFMENDTQVAILGTPGGSRIITMVLLGALEFSAGKPPADWVSLPRFHHQFLPDVIQFEPEAFDKETQEALISLGHSLKARDRSYGNMQAILWNRQDNQVSATSDPRGNGKSEIKTH